jgi:hypothetical protein
MNTKQQISALRKQMKAENVRTISCFNAGLSALEYLYNSQLYALKVKLSQEQAR